MPSISFQECFNELLHPSGLAKLDQDFLVFLQQENTSLYENLLSLRLNPKHFSPLALSELLLAIAPKLEDFLCHFFSIEKEIEATQLQTISHNPIAAFKKLFVLKRARKYLLNANISLSFAELNTWLEKQLKNAPITTPDKELAVALLGNYYLADPEKYANEIEQLTAWCVYAINSPEGQHAVSGWTSFTIPKRLDPLHLIPVSPCEQDPLHRTALKEEQLRLRDGFALTDPRMTAREVQDQVNYCIYCHDHEGDFCSKGFPVKKAEPLLGLKKNALDVTLTGCPLEEKISEMHELKKDGHTLAALAMLMVDNPMCPATGHRICNDCMKACIYQKQEPVNIPQIETRILTDVLALPWGVEIYDLLTRWNPLRPTQWLSTPYNGLKVMIAGMGPAGFTLAHHLLQEGFAVVGFDGLKLEPIAKHLLTHPIKHFSELTENLDERLMTGFGGVAEYGITVRWDKNFLKLIYLTLMRRPYFQAFGSTRFGGTITIEDAWEMGFDHFVIAVGAGLPKALAIPGSLAPGMRQANDFLMALQLTGAAKNTSLANLQVRLPAVIIGGGLTGVDTATEVQAYYIRQVEKTLARYEILVKHYDEEKIHQELDIASKEILAEFLLHGHLVRQERESAKALGQKPNFIKLIKQWGGVTIVYRRTMQESPAYINNHEELQKALEEGIYYAECLEPIRVELNHLSHVENLSCHRRLKNSHGEWETLAEELRIPARAIFVATGTQPNVAYAFEHKDSFKRHHFQYAHYEVENNEFILPHGISHCKEANFGPFTSYKKDDLRVSLIGDTHPVFHGNVVKAIASGLRTYPKIVALLKHKMKSSDDLEYQTFASHMQKLFASTLTQVKRCTENIIELTIHAPLAAKNFSPGQFYRLQNYETYAETIGNTVLQSEPLALLASEVDQQKGFLNFIVFEQGASSKLWAKFKEQPISLMGPTGVKSKIAHEHETILIIGNAVSMAFVRAYGPALKRAGNKVIYYADFNTSSEAYCMDKIEQATDVVIWSTRNGETIMPRRSQDYFTTGSCLDNLIRYENGLLAEKKFPVISLRDVDRVYLMSDTQLLKDFQLARKNRSPLAKLLIKDPDVLGSVYSTMQCMLKGVCAQCLQWQIDPETGQRTKAVFACSWQDQPLELIDIGNIAERQMQNALQEKLTTLWVDYLFSSYSLPKS